MLYTIELKSAPEFDRSYHPEPAEFVSLVLDTIREAGTLNRCILQSFDMRILKEIHAHEPEAKISLLLDHDFDLDEKLQELNFNPQFLGPKFTLVDEELIKACNERSIKVVPWTVNEVSDMERLIDLGVAGIITDYPNRKQLVRG
jgi:glycerophosphoryl diester phosphodiesterase